MITAQIASVPNRKESLKLTIESLHDQADIIYVALNDYKEIPPWMYNYPNVIATLTDNIMGDANKFIDVENRRGYVFTCDDDLIYPTGYTRRLMAAVDTHKSIISLLGKVYAQRPIKSFKRSYTELYRCLDEVKGEHRVDVGGTGAMAFHTDHIKVSMKDFYTRNMADIWMARIAHQQNIPIIVIPHPKGYLKHVKYDDRIWAQTINDQQQTDVLNSFLK